MVDDGIICIERTGYLGRRRHIFFSLKRQSEMFDRYRRKAERDYDEMEEMRLALEYGKKPRKKYRNGNCFVNTHLSYQFPLKGIDRGSAIDIAVKNMVTGREGLSTLMSNRPFSPSKVLELYRSRNSIETAFRDLKHGIDWRPANCSKPSAIKGRVLVSFLALFCMSMVRFLYPEFRHLSAESMTEQLTTFSLTLRRHQDGSEDRIFSIFCPIIRRLMGMKSSSSPRKSPDQWIKNNRPGNDGGVGNTLEDVLGIEENNLPIANAADWELKSHRVSSKSRTKGIHKEAAPLAAKMVSVILLPKYGWRHKEAGKKYPEDEKSFRVTLRSTFNERGFRIKVNRKDKKIEMEFNSSKVDPKHKQWLEEVIEKAGSGNIDPVPYWGFKDLECVICGKIKELLFRDCRH